MPIPTLQEQFGQIDIYLFDQLLKGRIPAGSNANTLTPDAGTAGTWFISCRRGYEVYGADSDARAVESVRSLARELAPTLPASNFRVEAIERMSFDDGFVDVVISSAVLHFASDEAQFESVLLGSWRVLKPGGIFFCRLASTIGIESPGRADSGTPLQVAGWCGAVSGGRSAARLADRTAGRRTA